MYSTVGSEEDPESGRDRADVEGMSDVKSLLSVICKSTGMGFAAVARVTADRWTAMAVRDDAGFGLIAGQSLDIDTTLCKESRAAREPIVIDEASRDPKYCEHHTPRIYNIESYVTVPIVLSDGTYFGNLCALDARALKVSEPHIVEMFELFARLIATQLSNVRRIRAAEAETRKEREAGMQRERFIAVLAHDLRNPLAAVDAGIAVMKQLANNSAIELIAERLSLSTRRMKLLVDDLVDYARGRLGEGVDVELDRIEDLDEAFRHVVAELQVVHPGRQLEVDIRVGCPVRGNRSRLQQLLSNLVGNALVHGSHSAPIRVKALVHDEQLLIEVANDGPPIPLELLPKVFDAFSSAKDGDSQRMGLGLFICSQVARVHAGTIEVLSDAVRGTVFTVRIPQAVN